ncbi:hypothetical protein K438DRAFT_2120611 [Mycena galopus ATCC 62051]|nr:hypothetical protein K438DRAFT_2120611 [Mycena galopus ATCC 62051]
MQTYDAACCAMIALGTLIDGPNTSFPPLTVADTFMKSVWQTRRVGDSKFTDADESQVDMHWVHHLLRLQQRLILAQMQNSVALKCTPESQVAPGWKVLAPGTVSRLEEKRQERTEGWLWQLGKMGRLSQNEMDEWSSEGDRVQWFRAEAEMQRWQEQKEQKIVELLRTVRSFLKMQQVWTQLGNEHSSNQPGHAAYARQKAAMFQRHTEEAQRLVRVGGYRFLLEPAANVIEYIEKETPFKEDLSVVKSRSSALKRKVSTGDGLINPGLVSQQLMIKQNSWGFMLSADKAVSPPWRCVLLEKAAKTASDRDVGLLGSVSIAAEYEYHPTVGTIDLSGSVT